MKFIFSHNNLNVLNLEMSLKFYKEALGLQETRRKVADDGSFTLVFLGDGFTHHKLELTWLRDRKEKYNLGDNEIHLAFTADSFEEAHALHEKMGCICYENEAMGIYFIEDPDGYWLEILPPEKKLKCPKCGAAFEEGRIVCSSPACTPDGGEEPPKAVYELKLGKDLKFNLVLDFQLLARIAAVLIVILAALSLYFSGRP